MTTLDRTVERHDAITERAAAYFERRRFESWSDSEQTELDTWLAESALHEAAFLRLEGAARLMDELAEFRNANPATVEKSDVHYRRFALPLLMAASFALFALFGVPYIVTQMQPPDRIDSTDVGGRTFLSFFDHTQIELNTDTAMRFRMTTAERTVWLEKGEAWFHVAHDAAHPFTVIVGKHRITDLGTEFLVRRDGGDVRVTLFKGRAALSAEGIQTATLVPGDEAVATPVSLSVSRKSLQELADELAWRHGLLVFRNTRLSEVVKEFNRYNATKLVIADPSIAGMKFSAAVKTDDYESFLQLVEVALKLRVDREGNDILISRDRKSEIGSRKSEARHVIPGEPRARAAREGNPGIGDSN